MKLLVACIAVAICFACFNIWFYLHPPAIGLPGPGDPKPRSEVTQFLSLIPFYMQLPFLAVAEFVLSRFGSSPVRTSLEFGISSILSGLFYGWVSLLIVRALKSINSLEPNHGQR